MSEGIHHLLEREIRESFKVAMAEIERGEAIEVDEALKELPNAGLRGENFQRLD